MISILMHIGLHGLFKCKCTMCVCFFFLPMNACKIFIIHVKLVPYGGLSSRYNIVCAMSMRWIGAMGSLVVLSFANVLARSFPRLH